MSIRMSAAILAAPLLFVLQVPGLAAETAADWKDDCSAYVKMLRDEGVADDLQITWCVAKSLGISQGLEAGSQIGAISMSSALVVSFGLGKAEVFEMFSERNAASLLQICMPMDTSAREKIEAVYVYLEARPERLEQPAALAFFEGLQARWPCSEPTS